MADILSAIFVAFRLKALWQDMDRSQKTSHFTLAVCYNEQVRTRIRVPDTAARVIHMQNIRESLNRSYIGAAGGFLAALAAGYILSGTSMAGVASFADISIAGALGLPASAAMFTGSLIHSIARSRVGADIVKIAAMAMIIIIKLFAEPKNSPKMCGINTAASVFLSGAAISAIIGELIYKLAFYLFYAAVAGITAYSAALIIMGVKRNRVIDLSSVSGCAYAVVYTVLTASLCSIEHTAVNIGIICGTAITMLGAYHYRHIGGVLCGALTTCGAFLASQETGMTVVLLPVGGLLCGYLYRQKVNTAAACFIGINFLLMILTGAVRDSVYNMINVICAAGAFIVIAPKFSDKWLRTGSESSQALPDIISTRMSFLSDSIETVRNESARIADLLEKNAVHKSPSDESCDSVCSQCFRKLTCWNIDRNKTLRGFHRLEKAPEISKETFPYELDDCLHKNELISAFERISRERACEHAGGEFRIGIQLQAVFDQMLVLAVQAGLSAAHDKAAVRNACMISCQFFLCDKVNCGVIFIKVVRHGLDVMLDLCKICALLRNNIAHSGMLLPGCQLRL